MKIKQTIPFYLENKSQLGKIVLSFKNRSLDKLTLL